MSDRHTKKRIALTFDDGPHAKYTPKILDILKNFDTKATFFLVGRRARQNPGIVKRIFKEGHDIGNHTYSHPVSPIAKKEHIEKEIRLTGKIIKRIVGAAPKLFRPTLLKCDIHSKKMKKTAEKLGCVSIRWSKSSADWLGVPKLIEHKVLKNDKLDTEVLLFHDGTEKSVVRSRQATVRTLPKILRHYKGALFLRLSDLILTRDSD